MTQPNVLHLYDDPNVAEALKEALDAGLEELGLAVVVHGLAARVRALVAAEPADGTENVVCRWAKQLDDLADTWEDEANFDGAEVIVVDLH